MSRQPDICIVGGAGHIGLPLALICANRGQQVLIYDINAEALRTIAAGTMPFMERDAAPLLTEAIANGRLSVSSRPADITTASTIIITVGTPVDEFLNPSMQQLVACVEQFASQLTAEHLLILRSTVSPGTTDWLHRYLQSRGNAPAVACCPERIVQGFAIKELQSLPQLISGATPEAVERAAAFFASIAPETIRLQPMEAEFAKLFCNAYRYIQFAATNQLYMMATTAGADYARIVEGMKRNYPRMRDLPSAGFSAGPCLFKDTMQLSAFFDNQFSLGHTAMLINEGLPLYVVRQLAQQHDLSALTVGLLGMAYKADIDDTRSSLSYKLKKALMCRARSVLTTDPYVADPTMLPVETVVQQSDILILCVPHHDYAQLELHDTPVVDIWSFFGARARPALTVSSAVTPSAPMPLEVHS